MNKPLADTKILALIPAFNETCSIASVVEGARRYLSVLVIDDGSSDTTAECARQAGAEVLLQRPNQGKGAALRAGFRRALEDGYEAVLTLDADGQHDPQEIPTFLAAGRLKPFGLIIGARDFSRMPFVRRLANSLGRACLSLALGQPVRDNQSGYRLIAKPVMQAMLNSSEQGFEFEVEMVAVCLRLGCLLDWVPIQTIYQGEKSHIQPWQHVKNFLRVAWKVRQNGKIN
ncbi:MAG: glycosyltransferase family 2 protein [Anaerolineaceae bacterium]|nr:glycosyltransferase family 2 protein [Anaerolineaceae bacterium]